MTADQKTEFVLPSFNIGRIKRCLRLYIDSQFANVPDDAIAFRARDIESITAAVANGMGIGPVLCWPALAGTARPSLERAAIVTICPEFAPAEMAGER